MRKHELHGHTAGGWSPEYRAWASMKARCEIPSATGFRDYGARGIRVCGLWSSSFSAFLADVGLRPSPSHSLDRMDVNGSYEPGNVRWATRQVQASNTRRAVSAIARTAEQAGIKADTLRKRLRRRGMNMAEAVALPVRAWNRVVA